MCTLLNDDDSMQRVGWDDVGEVVALALVNSKFFFIAIIVIGDVVKNG